MSIIARIADNKFRDAETNNYSAEWEKDLREYFKKIYSRRFTHTDTHAGRHETKNKGEQMMVSKKFIEALISAKESGKPLHQIAWDAGVSPGMLYKISAGIDRPKPGDKRVKKLCVYLGLSEDEAYADEQGTIKSGVA